MANFTLHHKNFLWTGKTRSFVSDASDLRILPNMVVREFWLQGNTQKVCYQLSYTLKGNEGWVYLPRNDMIQLVPGCAGTKVVIHND